MTRVKLCGLRSGDDARSAIEAGADMLGFVCAPASQRYVSVAQLQQIAMQLRSEYGAMPHVVAVVAGTPLVDIEQLAACGSVDAIQISDVDDRLACDVLATVRRASATIGVIRAIHVGAGIDHTERARRWSTEHGARILYDALGAGRAAGGSGTRLDLDLLDDDAVAAGSCGIAGGLAPATVGAVVTRMRPSFVDVSSGIESATGQKSARLMRDFVQAARAAIILSEQPQELLR